MAAFKPHGETTVEVRGRAVVLRPHGNLNEEEVERLLREISALRKGFGGGPWGIMVVVWPLALLTVLAEQASSKAFPDLVAAGLGALAFVIPELGDRPLIEAQLRRVVAQSPCPVNVFPTEGEAEAWLASALVPRP